MRRKYGRRGRSDKRTARELLAREDRQRLLLIEMFVRAGGRALDTFIAVSGRAAIEAVSAPRMWPHRGSRVGEGAIPAYEVLRRPKGLGDRMLKLLTRGSSRSAS